MAEETTDKGTVSTKDKVEAIYEAITSRKSLEDIVKEKGFSSDIVISKNQVKFLVKSLPFLAKEDLVKNMSSDEKAKLKKSLGKGLYDMISHEEAKEIMDIRYKEAVGKAGGGEEKKAGAKSKGKTGKKK